MSVSKERSLSKDWMPPHPEDVEYKTKFSKKYKLESKDTMCFIYFNLQKEFFINLLDKNNSLSSKEKKEKMQKEAFEKWKNIQSNTEKSNFSFKFPDVTDKFDNYDELVNYILHYKIRERDEFCQNLGEEVDDNFINSEAVFVLSGKNKPLPNGNIFAFAIVNFKKDPRQKDILNIEIICSNVNIKNAGSLLLKNIEDFCSVNGFSRIELDSVPTAVGFYEKYGFKGRCIKNKNCNMYKLVRGAMSNYSSFKTGGKLLSSRKMSTLKKNSRGRKHRKSVKRIIY